MKILLNLVAFTVITIGAVYGYLTIASSTQEISTEDHSGHDHAGHSHAAEVQVAGAPATPPAERDPNRLWCREHGVYEDECVLCHPEIARDKSAASLATQETHDHDHAEHDEPAEQEEEDHAGHDHEAVVHDALDQDLHADHDHGESVGEEGAPSVLYCSTHRVEEMECGICQPQLAAFLKPGEHLYVRLPAAASGQKAGVQTQSPVVGMVDSNQHYICEVQFDQNHYARISPLAGGVIVRTLVNQGDTVKKGQVLVEVASNEIAKAKSDYLKALDQEQLMRLTYNREKALAEKQITAKQDVQQAEADYQAAQTEVRTTRQQLLNFGLSDGEIQAVRTERSSASTLKIRAPFDGTVLDKRAVLGEAVNPGDPVFEIVNLDTMWLELSIPESQVAGIETGMVVQAAFSSLPSVEVQGTLTWILPQIDPTTRMIKARAEVKNPGHRLKERMFGTVRIQGESRPSQLIVAKDAIQQVNAMPFVFVKQEDDLFELRRVETGNQAAGRVEIVQGLQPNDAVVVANSFVLKSELLKSQFGAGCAHD